MFTSRNNLSSPRGEGELCRFPSKSEGEDYVGERVSITQCNGPDLRVTVMVILMVLLLCQYTVGHGRAKCVPAVWVNMTEYVVGVVKLERTFVSGHCEASKLLRQFSVTLHRLRQASD